MRLFTNHPATVGESYFAHMRSALGFAISMLLGALACLVHSILPFLFQRTGSRIISKLHDRMLVNRSHLKGNSSADTQHASR